jgi:hypothetical protein
MPRGTSQDQAPKATRRRKARYRDLDAAAALHWPPSFWTTPAARCRQLLANIFWICSETQDLFAVMISRWAVGPCFLNELVDPGCLQVEAPGLSPPRGHYYSRRPLHDRKRTLAASGLHNALSA